MRSPLSFSSLLYSIRSLSNAKAFVAVSVLSLSAGVAASAFVLPFTLAAFDNRVRGVRDPEGIMELVRTSNTGSRMEWSLADLESVRESETPLSVLAAYKLREGVLGRADGSEPVEVLYVSSGYDDVLGLTPTVGRMFVPEDDTPGSAPVAILSYRRWMDQFNGDSAVVGTTVSLNRNPHTVVGVLPATFIGHRMGMAPDFLVPLSTHPYALEAFAIGNPRTLNWALALGRLADTGSIEQVNESLRSVFAGIRAEEESIPEVEGAFAVRFGPVPPLGRSEAVLGGLAVVGLAILALGIICANLMGMMVARAAAQEREIAVRMALGAGRGRIVADIMMEACILATAAMILGALGAYWSVEIASAMSLEVARMIEFSGGVSASGVVGSALLFGVLSALGFGIWPAIRSSRPGIVTALKDDTGVGGRRVGRLHKIAASAQSGLAIFLVVNASLFLRSADIQDNRDSGFDYQGLMVMQYDLDQEGYSDPEDAREILIQLAEALDAARGVESVTMGSGFPMDHSSDYVAVRTRREDERPTVVAEFTRVGPRYFEVLDIPVIQGRGIASSDLGASRPVAVVTRRMAEALWPGQSAVGQSIWMGFGSGDPRRFDVVGVVQDVASSFYRPESEPQVFLSVQQVHLSRVAFLVRRGTGFQAPDLREAVNRVDPGLSVPRLLPVSTIVGQSTAVNRMSGRIAAALALVVLVLAVVGLYGMISVSVTQRTREIGVRVAMGATRSMLLRLVLGDCLRVSLPGVAMGALLAVVAGFVSRSSLFGLNPLDPITLLATSSVLFLVVGCAGAVPAARAARVDPMVVLRTE